MCGIAGIVRLEGLSEEEKKSIENMVSVLHHRGPDNSGTFTDDSATLGHARLSIIDLESGHQPMSNEAQTVWVIYNGEIYNFPELQKKLIAKGHRFRTRSDTETIIHLYEEEGEHCVERLRGMFAFALWDQRLQKLFLARDPVGIKPLYFSFHDNRLLFGSELKALLKAPHCPRSLDPQALQDFLTFMWIPAPKSIFQGIQKLPAGHIAVFDKNGLRLKQYWDLHFEESESQSEAFQVEQFREYLREAVQLRLISDVPLGAFLSGGIDSSAVVATMAQLNSQPVLTNSIGFKEQAFNELNHADTVAEKFQTNHHRHIVRPDALDILPKLSWHWDEPFADPSAIPTFYVSSMARRNVKVALSGDGGDENLAGYRRYKLSQRQRGFRRYISPFFRRTLFAPAASLYPKVDWLPRIFRAKSTLQELASSDLESLFLTRAAFAPAIIQRLLNSDMRHELKHYDSRSVIEQHYSSAPTRDPLHRELYVDIKTYLVDDILTKVDRASMAVGLEVRVPLLDHRFMEFMASLPSSMKLRGAQGKYLFKQAFRHILGRQIVDRTKMGFRVPVNQWLKGPLRELVEETLFSPHAYISNWLDRKELRRLWNAHLAGISHMGSLIWAVLMLELWAQSFLSTSQPLQPVVH